jgi:hypothetical protein
VSTRPVRQAQAAAQAAAVQAAAEARQQDARHHGHHGAGHRGHFGGYVFRLVRAPAPPPPRRPVPLRRRPRPPGAGMADMDHENEHGLLLNMPLLPQSSAVEDQQRAAAMDVAAMGRQDDPREDPQQQETRRDPRALQWRLGSQRRLDADAGLPTLQAACGAAGQALWAQAPVNAAMRAEDLARALVGALAGLNAAGGPSVAGQGATTLQMAAVRAYLLKVLEAGVAGRPLGTLGSVKQALLELRRPPGVAMPDEAQQDRNLLLPLKLLNADRPRTPQQVRQACSRIELSCQAGPVKVPTP